jgi:hypothetical protein
MRPKARLTLETAIAAVFAAIFVATAFWSDWIELVFGPEPDEGNGQFEWTIVATSGLLAVASIIVARSQRRRPMTDEAVRTALFEAVDQRIARLALELATAPESRRAAIIRDIEACRELHEMMETNFARANLANDRRPAAS